MNRFLLLNITILLMLAISGCGEKSQADPRLVLAEKCRAEGDFKAAERQYLRYLRSNPEDAEAHLKLASLCDESLNDPVGAVYHYREFLRLDPDSGQRQAVETWMESALKKCASPEEKTPDRVQAERLARENAALRQLAVRQQNELLKMRRQTPPVVNAPPQQLPQQAAPAQAPVPAPAPAVQKTYIEYTIKRGDTLGRIARHYYGSAQKIGPILEANNLTPRTVLHIGQTLKIPQQTR